MYRVDSRVFLFEKFSFLTPPPQAVVNDNLSLAATLVENEATNRAVVVLEENLKDAIALRHSHRANYVGFF